MMPGGSVIGCPKIKTLELLNNQEKESRNIFKTVSYEVVDGSKENLKIIECLQKNENEQN